MTQLDLRGLLGEYVDLSSEELPSRFFYYYLKNFYNNSHQYYQVCDLVKSLPNTDSDIFNICRKFVKHLKTNYEKLDDSDLKDHHCNLLSLWIYEELDKKLEGNFSSITPIYGKLQLILSYLFNKPKGINCLRNVNLLASDTWKKSKDLYDFCVDYDEIIKKPPSNYKKCKEYETYIQGISRLYKNFESLYIQSFKDDNIEFYKKCKSYDTERMFRELKCEEKFPEQVESKVEVHDQGPLASTPVLGQKSDSTDTYGNVLLGVVATSMTSGMIFKVNKILIKTYQHYKLFNNLFAIQINSK
ncbi:hypothetical protein PVBG_05708 [Plasmodium vivax Brazil I]|uniref:Uncharacterized protein n=1 Tax=Plasmodium vivax (strain Brazil I) TaxID=1033975 RepID=A0A0J9T196_PLAV1|nr:hypothetical protein PVBG_05708 [Plasmodium vivax Brazil I]